jgi:O-acetyl-ADP-ribose deacetylase (regulator of RNase III)
MELKMADEKRINQTALRLIVDDITDIDIEAFVFYAQHSLALGSGFGTAISTRGGSSIQKALDELGTLETTQVVVTEAGKLKANYIVHAVGPRFQEEDIEAKLKTTILNVLKQCEEKGIKQIAMPAMGAGFYGIPLEVCARIMIGTITDYLKSETGLQERILCGLDSRELKPFQAQFNNVN